MKKIFFSIAWVVLFMFVSSSYAAETVLDHISTRDIPDSKLPNLFSIVVTGSGKFIAKLGPVFTTGDDVKGMELPYLLDHPKAISYPRWAVSQGWQGKLILAIEIRKDGTTGAYQIMQSTGYDPLDQEAIYAMQSWKFHPALKDGKPVRTCIQIPIRFQLKDE